MERFDATAITAQCVELSLAWRVRHGIRRRSASRCTFGIAHHHRTTTCRPPLRSSSGRQFSPWPCRPRRFPSRAALRCVRSAACLHVCTAGARQPRRRIRAAARHTTRRPRTIPGRRRRPAFDPSPSPWPASPLPFLCPPTPTVAPSTLPPPPTLPPTRRTTPRDPPPPIPALQARSPVKMVMGPRKIGLKTVVGKFGRKSQKVRAGSSGARVRVARSQLAGRPDRSPTNRDLRTSWWRHEAACNRDEADPPLPRLSRHDH